MAFKKMTYLAALAAICFASSVFAQSLSDIDMQLFEAKTGKGTAKMQADPFVGGQTSAEDLTFEDLHLSGVAFMNETEAHALINGYLVRPGDYIAGCRVEKIYKDRVVLRRVDETYVLTLGGGL